jgi:hypothetical protein
MPDKVDMRKSITSYVQEGKYYVSRHETRLRISLFNLCTRHTTSQIKQQMLKTPRAVPPPLFEQHATPLRPRLSSHHNTAPTTIPFLRPHRCRTIKLHVWIHHPGLLPIPFDFHPHKALRRLGVLARRRTESELACVFALAQIASVAPLHFQILVRAPGWWTRTSVAAEWREGRHWG